MIFNNLYQYLHVNNIVFSSKKIYFMINYSHKSFFFWDLVFQLRWLQQTQSSTNFRIKTLMEKWLILINTGLTTYALNIIFRGKVVIVVNVATFWKLTVENYTQLQELYTQYASEGLCVLAFPCNQFGAQVIRAFGFHIISLGAWSRKCY